MKPLYVLWLALASMLIAQPPMEAPAVRRVALVFDDGPEPQQGPRLQAVLAREGVRVSFAHVGRNAERHSEVTQAAVAAGHEIVNHSYSHAAIGELEAAEVANEVTRGQQALSQAAGQPPRWYWPPYLAIDPRLRRSVEEAELRIFVPHHLVDPKDWDQATTAADILRVATTGVRDGSVILFHEWRRETVEQLPAIIAELRRQGCAFLTYSQLAAALQEHPPAEEPDPATQAMFSAALVD